jgi:DNA-binding response OmpR family regulator
VDEAGSGAGALKLIGNAAYDCVLLDYYLPDIDGLSLFERLRFAAPDLPVMILTGRGDEDIAVELMGLRGIEWVIFALKAREKWGLQGDSAF